MFENDDGWQRIIDALVEGDEQAAIDFWDAYGKRLLSLADKQLDSSLKRRFGPSDVVNSAYRSFLRHAQQGDYELSDGNVLWPLLRDITINKVRQYVRFHRRQKRTTDREKNGSDGAGDGFSGGDFNGILLALLDGDLVEVETEPLGAAGTVNLDRGALQGVQLSSLFAATAVPEPASIAIWSLLGLGLAGFGYYRTRRKK